nr:MAG TPA: hypothetical protein [Caudoviricetes sp.]
MHTNVMKHEINNIDGKIIISQPPRLAFSFPIQLLGERFRYSRMLPTY